MVVSNMAAALSTQLHLAYMSTNDMRMMVLSDAAFRSSAAWRLRPTACTQR